MPHNCEHYTVLSDHFASCVSACSKIVDDNPPKLVELHIYLCLWGTAYIMGTMFPKHLRGRFYRHAMSGPNSTLLHCEINPGTSVIVDLALFICQMCTCTFAA
jgi:hypothetical protein